MVEIKRDVFWYTTQRAADQAGLRATAVNLEQIELEEMPAQTFDYGPLSRVGGLHVGQLDDRHITHGCVHRALA